MLHNLKIILTIIGLSTVMLQLVPGVGTAASYNCRKADHKTIEAVKKLKSDPAASLRLFDEARKLCPENATNQFNLGLAYFKDGKSKQAEKYFAKAVELENKDSRFRNALAWVMLENGTGPRKALKHAEISGRGNKASYKDTLIRAYKANKLYDKALFTAERSTIRWPDDNRIMDRFREIEGIINENEDVEKCIPDGVEMRPNAIAVVIGNKRYKNNIPYVEYADRDAATIKKYLILTMGYSRKNVITLDNASLSDFRKWFGTEDNDKCKLSRRLKKTNDSEIFIYYSGHGYTDIETKHAYLVPVDAELPSIANTGYPRDLLIEKLNKLPVKRVTIVLDTCYNGQSHAGHSLIEGSGPIVYIEKPTKLEKGAIFFSSGKTETSYWYKEKKHGLFTYFFLKGLGGKADKDKDNSISFGELGSYLEEQVPHYADQINNGKQTPALVVSGFDENLEIVKLRWIK